MTSTAAATIAAIYRDVLTESIATARASSLDDADARLAVECAFNSSIPTTVPIHLAVHIGSPELRALLRSDAAQLLVRICERRPLPRGLFVDALLRIARRTNLSTGQSGLVKL